MGRCDRGTTVTVASAGRCSERGIIDTDAPPSLYSPAAEHWTLHWGPDKVFLVFRVLQHVYI